MHCAARPATRYNREGDCVRFFHSAPFLRSSPDESSVYALGTGAGRGGHLFFARSGLGPRGLFTGAGKFAVEGPLDFRYDLSVRYGLPRLILPDNLRLLVNLGRQILLAHLLRHPRLLYGLTQTLVDLGDPERIRILDLAGVDRRGGVGRRVGSARKLLFGGDQTLGFGPRKAVGILGHGRAVRSGARTPAD